MLLNIWGFWVAAQPHNCKQMIKDYHFPLIYSPAYQFHSYFNLEWSLHHIDWRTSRTVFKRLQRYDLLHRITKEEKREIEEMAAEGISYENYIKSRKKLQFETMKKNITLQPN